MWLLFVPMVMLVVLVLAATLFAGVFWVIGASWPWLLIGLGMWLFWRDDGRHHRARRQRLAWDTGSRHGHKAARREQSAQQQPAEKRSAPPPLAQDELPIDIQVKVEQIRRKVDVLLSYADRFPPFSQDLYLVRQTASDYLPRTIGAYLALPKQTGAEKPVSPDGKTAYQELKAQLDLLDAKLDDIAQDLQRQDTDRLLANRRFLEARFGSRTTKPILDTHPGIA